MSNQITTVNGSVFSVCVVPESFTRTEMGTISGIVYIKVGHDFAFPDTVWDDVVVEDLNLWVSNALTLYNGIGTHRECWFMDGGFQFDIEAQKSGLWTVRFLDTRREEAVLVREESFEPQVVIKALLDAAKTTIEVCRKKGWSHVRLNDLAVGYSKLAQVRNELSPVAILNNL